MKGKLLAASVTRRGASHAKTGRPNEDSVCVELLPRGRGIIAAVSDGAGSAGRAKEGSRLAADYAVRRARQVILDENETPAFAVHTGLLAARKAIRSRAMLIRDARMSDYHCTLILVAWVYDQVAAIQVGNGAAIVESDSVCKMLTIPQRGEYVNETFFVTEPHFQQTMFSRETSGITALALFTDGLQKHAVDFQNRRAKDAFIPQAISILRAVGERECTAKTIEDVPPDVVTSSFQAALESSAAEIPGAGASLFNWLAEEVGQTEDDMSLIVAALCRDG